MERRFCFPRSISMSSRSRAMRASRVSRSVVQCACSACTNFRSASRCATRLSSAVCSVRAASCASFARCSALSSSWRALACSSSALRVAACRVCSARFRDASASAIAAARLPWTSDSSVLVAVREDSRVRRRSRVGARSVSCLACWSARSLVAFFDRACSLDSRVLMASAWDASVFSAFVVRLESESWRRCTSLPRSSLSASARRSLSMGTIFEIFASSSKILSLPAVTSFAEASARALILLRSASCCLAASRLFSAASIAVFCSSTCFSTLVFLASASLSFLAASSHKTTFLAVSSRAATASSFSLAAASFHFIASARETVSSSSSSSCLQAFFTASNAAFADFF
mmetsp:Transcript_31481/g.61440  ORF Transcript_31481/g.61440 Transcript_31481/m.61440 type:complete len:346 (-) Transcript_31481:613-1650(-)